MKKSLIALAVASAVSAPAFAATSNVDIYGVLNVDVNYVDSDVTNKDAQVGVSSSASRIGFKGTEDLGGGLAAIWQVESGFNADEGGGTIGSRNTYVGLKGGWGTILAGRHDTPMKLLGRAVDNFGDIMADDRNIIGASGANGTSMFDLRTNNTIAYISPDFSGFTVAAAYVTDHQTSITNVGSAAACVTGLDCNKNDAFSVSATYNNGPLMLGAGYEKHNVAGIATAAFAGTPYVVGSTIDEAPDMWRIVGSYAFGNFKLGGLYEQGSSDKNGITASADRNAWGVFANYAMGAVTLKANYLAADSYANTSDTGADQWTIGADYALSKRTTAYAYYASLSNDNNAAFALGLAQGVSDNTGANVGTNPSAFGIGVKHSF